MDHSRIEAGGSGSDIEAANLSIASDDGVTRLDGSAGLADETIPGIYEIMPRPPKRGFDDGDGSRNYGHLRSPQSRHQVAADRIITGLTKPGSEIFF